MELISSEKREKSEVELIIGITPEELEAAMNKAYIKNKGRITVPGFRKGKAPRKIIEKMYGSAMFLNDALDSLMPDVLDFTMKDTGLDIVGYPKVTNIDLKDNDTRAEITLTAAQQPEVKIGKYKGLSAPKPDLRATDEEIDRELSAIRERNARQESVERPAEMGDIVLIDFEGFIDEKPFEGGKGKGYNLELGSGTFIPGFEDKIVGMSISEERDIDLVFPDNYKEDLAGKPVVFKVKLLEVKEKELPELDDEFAKDVSEFDTLEEYKASIREKIETSRSAEVDEVFENLLMEQIIDSMEAEVPDAMVDEQMDKSTDKLSRQISAFGMKPAEYMKMVGLTPEEFKERMWDTAAKQVRTMLALEEIAKLENIEIGQDEIDEEYKAVAAESKMELDKVREIVQDKDVIRSLMVRAAAKIVVDSAIIEEPKKTKTPKKEKIER